MTDDELAVPALDAILRDNPDDFIVPMTVSQLRAALSSKEPTE